MKREKAEHLTDLVRYTKNEVINVFQEETDPEVDFKRPRSDKSPNNSIIYEGEVGGIAEAGSHTYLLDPSNQLFTSYFGSVRVLRKAIMAA
jgi:hypothetical protein